MTLHDASDSICYFRTSEVANRVRGYGFDPISLMTNTLIQITAAWGISHYKICVV